MGEIIGQIHVLVKKEIAEAGSNYEANGQGENKFLGDWAHEPHLSGAFLALNQEVARHEPCHIHEAIPADMKGANGY